MYIVGANLLKAHWVNHPRSEGELRALHALLAETDAEALAEALGEIASFDANGAELKLGTAIVSLEISAAIGVARYAAVAAVPEEES